MGRVGAGRGASSDRITSRDWPEYFEDICLRRRGRSATVSPGESTYSTSTKRYALSPCTPLVSFEPGSQPITIALRPVGVSTRSPSRMMEEYMLVVQGIEDDNIERIERKTDKERNDPDARREGQKDRQHAFQDTHYS